MPDPQTVDRLARTAQLVGRFAWAWAKHGLGWLSAHTGLPVVLVAGVALVISWRLARRGARFAVEVAVATALIALATHFGLVRW